MAALPVEILFGVYLGILTGIVPGLAAWSLGFAFKYFTGVTIPGLGVVVLALAITGVQGGLLALTDPAFTQEGQERFIVALLVVLMISLYAHSKGDKWGAEFPRKLSLKRLRDRTLSTDVVEFVGGRREVNVRVAGTVGDIEGYPPLSPDLRAELGADEWTFPADIPVGEIESRLADRLRTDYDLSEVSVRVDERARATIYAAPPVGGVSKRLPSGKRAVSLTALVPTGVSRGDEVTVHAGGVSVDGAVVSAQSDGSATEEHSDSSSDATTDGGTDDESDLVPASAAPVTLGGEGRLTLAVDRADAKSLLAADGGQVVVRSRGTHREFELVGLLRRTGQRFRRLSVRQGSDLDGATLGEASVRDTYGVAVLAVRADDEWRLAPRGGTTLSAGGDLFAVGTPDALAAFEEVVA